MGMVDVGQKQKTKRLARAKAFVKLNKEIIKQIKDNGMPKGNVLECARIAGILAAKNTPSLIPLCHNIELENVNLYFEFKDDGIRIESSVRAFAKTGVEMEAVVACSVAAITIYDMSKMFSRAIKITDIELLEKRGGKSGRYIKK